MKSLSAFFLFLFTITGICFAQNAVVDTHPGVSILVIDPQSGQLVPATSDAAIIFKDAFVELVNHTTSARMQAPKMVPGRKSIIISQADPQTNGNAYVLTLQSKFFRQNTTIYSYLYNVDQNTLYNLDISSNRWQPEVVQGANVLNLNRCLEYGKFNEPVANGPLDDSQQISDSDLPVDNDVEVAVIPPALPEYEQPECPSDGFLWQPGYWAYSLASNNYYWVPGVWVSPPTAGYLWTPPYWGYDGFHYRFHAGYWGRTIGFYGGINYGYGYGGVGFYGGEWRGERYHYNTAVVRVNRVSVHNTYINTTVINTTVVTNHSSFNGRGGIVAKPTSTEIAAMKEQHVNATPEQIRNQRIAREDKNQFASSNIGGKPANLAAVRPPDRAPVNNPPRGPGNTGVSQRPGMNNAPRNNTPGNPASNQNAPGTTAPNSNTPGSNGVRSNTPVATTPNPNAPGNPAVRPNAPGTMPPNPNAPGNTGTRPNTPGTGGTRPNLPVQNGPGTKANPPGTNGPQPNPPAAPVQNAPAVRGPGQNPPAAPVQNAPAVRGPGQNPPATRAPAQNVPATRPPRQGGNREPKPNKPEREEKKKN